MFTIPFLTSCNHCREKKRKCNGEKPACSLCRAHGVPCEYRRSRRFRKRAQNTTMPLHSIMPAPADPLQQDPSGYQPAASLTGGPSSLIIPQSINGLPGPQNGPMTAARSFPEPFSQGSNIFAVQPQQQEPQPQQFQQKPITGVNALSRLLAGDMYPQTQQLPQPILQGVNTYMSPFSTTGNQTIPEWVSLQNPEAEMISNLENIASAYQASPLLTLQHASTPDGATFGNLSSQLIQNTYPFQANQFQVNQQRQPPQMVIPNSTAAASALNATKSFVDSPFTLPNALASVSAGTAIPAARSTSSAFSQSPPTHRDLASNSYNNQSSSLINATQDSEFNRVASPGGDKQQQQQQSLLFSSSSARSPSVSAASDITTSFSNLLSPAESTSKGNFGNFNTDKPRACENGDAPDRPAPCFVSSSRYPESYVPEIIVTYAKDFPGDLSPEVLLKVMRVIYSSTRTSLVNVDIELSWCMILKGVIPRILLFAYIASMARGQVIEQELMQQLPAKFDEMCYEYAVKDIPLVAASPSLWSALSLHLIARYEFQSARYDLMQQHFEMAADVLTRTTFHGHAFPWDKVPAAEKRSFEYDYYVYTYWVGFQWHLVCCLNLDRPFNMDLDSAAMPVPTSDKGYFAPDLPCEFDLLTLLPASSWPRSKQTENLTEVWFRGLNDPEFEAWRPPEWKAISPNYKITVSLQRMLPLGAELYRLQCNFCDDKVSLIDYLQRLRAKQERLKRWLYSLPEEFEITQEMVARLAKAAVNQSTPGTDSNLIMNFKELVMTLGLYNTLLIRANRVAILGMLDEDLSAPATAMHMRVFGVRDYIEAASQRDNGDKGDSEGVWQKNLAFHRCRMQCYESMNILCDVVQLSFMLRLNLFTYGTTYVAIAGEMLNVLISQLGIDDKYVKWRTKTRLAHVLCLLRSLQHWAPAIYLFVYGIQALSDPAMVLDVDDCSLHHQQMGRRGQQTSSLSPASQTGSVQAGGTTQSERRQQQSDERAVPGIANPFPRNHIINLIVDDLDISLATFLAPAYPMLLLKIFASNM
ncbi:hypothetical protein GQ54DRAFT_277217 [Martensiomyces pterosporus]|nr:hypothetical protein GQ54DRAFT_277217 [Martensiomyces pterosporus]